MPANGINFQTAHNAVTHSKQAHFPATQHATRPAPKMGQLKWRRAEILISSSPEAQAEGCWATKPP